MQRICHSLRKPVLTIISYTKPS
ncbi:hypothetical protein EMIT0194MI4_10017 [Pseudomonas sp. IT-194MI4]